MRAYTAGYLFSRALLLLCRFNMCFSIFFRACFRLSVLPSFLAGYLLALTFCLFRAMCFPALSCWLCFSAIASAYLFSRTFLSVICFPHFLAGYVSSRTFLPVMYLPALSSRLFVYLRYLAGYLFTLSTGLGLCVLSAFLPVLSLPALRTGCDCLFLHSSRLRGCNYNLSCKSKLVLPGVRGNPFLLVDP